MKKTLIAVFAALLLSACAGADYLANMAIPVNFHAVKNGDVTTLEVTSEKKADYETNYDADKGILTVFAQSRSLRMGEYLAASPLLLTDSQAHYGGLVATFKVGVKATMVREDIKDGVRLTFQTQEEDADTTSMVKFGGWADTGAMASKVTGIERNGDAFKLKLDSYPAYELGRDGGRDYMDVFNVDIPQGNIRAKEVTGISRMTDRTRIFFSPVPDFCPDGTGITFGQKCDGYSSLFGMERKVTDGGESFSFTLTGNPLVTEIFTPQMTAFGINNVKVFGNMLETYTNASVYKMQIRENEGMIWLVFLHDKGVRYRQYFNGDKFFVVFYKG